MRYANCPLTDRELQIVERVALGDSNSQIAEALFLTTNTIKSHLARIARRLGVSSRAAIVALCIRNRWID